MCAQFALVCVEFLLSCLSDSTSMLTTTVHSKVEEKKPLLSDNSQASPQKTKQCPKETASFFSLAYLIWFFPYVVLKELSVHLFQNCRFIPILPTFFARL